MLFVGTSIIHPSTEGVFLLCNILDLLIYSLQIFFELMLRYHISVDQFLLDTQPEKDTKRRQLDALLDDMSDTGIRIVTATAKEIAEVENEN